jgi:hypothetical protein
MEEKYISTLKEMLALVREYSKKGLYFRGECEDYEQISCLPAICRNSCGYSSNEINREWFTNILELLGVGTPYHNMKDGSMTGNIKEALLNTPEWAWRLWEKDEGEEKLKALMTHYFSDFEYLTEKSKNQCAKQVCIPFKSSYLNITPDIITALHFACSQFKFMTKEEADKAHKQPIPEYGDGYLFVFDLKEIENTQYVKLVSYVSYAYFYKKEEELHYQPFDRITHQRGAFLTFKKDKKNAIEYDEFKKELKKVCLYERITIAKNVKQDLFNLFGGKNGLKYYFPKIPCEEFKSNDTQKIYANMEGVTLLC